MPLTPIPAAVASWQKWLVQLGVEVSGAVAAYLLSQLQYGADADAVALEWRRYVCTWTRATPTGTVEDTAQVGFDFVNLTDGAVDTSWDATDYSTIGDAVAAWAFALAPYQGPSSTGRDIKAYVMRFNPSGDPSKPFADSGPPAYMRTINYVGSGTTQLPYQVAATLTERTTWPKHWGRCYVPTLSATALGANGRLASAFTTALANASQTLYTAGQSRGLHPVVPVTQIDKQVARGLLAVTSLQVDDIPDVQRRRRPKQAASRTLRP